MFGAHYPKLLQQIAPQHHSATHRVAYKVLTSFQHAVFARTYLDFEPETKPRSCSEAVEKYLKFKRKVGVLSTTSAPFSRGKGTSGAQPINEPALKVENDSQKVDEYDQSMRLEDLDEEESALLDIAEATNRELTQQLTEMYNLLAQTGAKKRVISAAMSIPLQETTIYENANHHIE